MLLTALYTTLSLFTGLILRRFIRQWWCTRSLNNIPGPPAQSTWTGVLNQIFDPINGWSICTELMQTYGGVIKIRGVLGVRGSSNRFLRHDALTYDQENRLYIFDPLALEDIFGKNQEIYDENDAYYVGNRVIFGEGILASSGSRHRLHRKALSPLFSTSQMRNMNVMFYEVVHKCRNTLAKKVAKGPQQVDVLLWMTRISLELIAQGGLGRSFDSLTEDSIVGIHPYARTSRQLLPLVCQSMILRDLLMPPVVKFGLAIPRVSRFLLNLVPWGKVRMIKNVVDVLHDTSVNIVHAKQRALDHDHDPVIDHKGQWKDIISILMKTNLDAPLEDRLSEEELVGQVTSLTFAATDTTSNALARILHILAQHPEVQTQLREEIVAAKQDNGFLDYSVLESQPYLDAVCRETLRLYPRHDSHV